MPNRTKSGPGRVDPARLEEAASLAADRLEGMARVTPAGPTEGFEGIVASIHLPRARPGSEIVLDFTFGTVYERFDRMRVHATEVRRSVVVPLAVSWVCPPPPRVSDPAWRVAEFVVTATHRAVQASLAAFRTRQTRPLP